MDLEVYLIKDKDSNVIANFTNKRRATDYVARNPNTEIERIEVVVPRLYRSNVGQSENRDYTTKTLDEHTRDYLKRVIFEENSGNIKKSSKILNIHENTLRHRMKKLGLL